MSSRGRTHRRRRAFCDYTDNSWKFKERVSASTGVRGRDVRRNFKLPDDGDDANQRQKKLS